MSSVDDDLKKFEIIKTLWATVAIRKRSSTDYRDIEKETKIPENKINGFIRILHNAGYVDSQYFPEVNLRTAYLTKPAFSIMDRKPQPVNYNEFTSRVAYPDSDFGTVIEIENLKTIKEKISDFLEHFKRWIAIGASIVAILAGAKTLGFW